MRRIMAVNVMAIGILAGGILYLNQFRDNLIDRQLEQLTTTGEIIAGAIGESAASGPEATEVDLVVSRQILARLASPTRNRARLFSVGGQLLADSRLLDPYGDILARPLPPLDAVRPLDDRLFDQVNEILDLVSAQPLYPLYRERPDQVAGDYGEVVAALGGEVTSAIRRREDGVPVITVAVPVQRFRRVLGALMISVEAEEIEALVRAERLVFLQVFGISLGVTLFMSFFLATTIARPIRRLARAADEVRHNIGRSQALPLFRDRQDEIGDLSRSLSDMMAALYRQIDAGESFAADVSHEIKNPLTSIRSAVETMRRTDDKAIQERLLDIVEEDIKRLDRLISDIADASRLDAELARGSMEPVDIGGLVQGIVGIYRDTGAETGPEILVDVTEEAMAVQGIEDRLSQVIRNLIDNAISFTGPGGTITVTLSRDGKTEVLLRVDDSGPGLPQGAADKIFDRFYSERPEGEAFGTHSGLGLSISRQVVEAHGGSMTASNRPDGTSGARFDVRLPG